LWLPQQLFQSSQSDFEHLQAFFGHELCMKLRSSDVKCMLMSEWCPFWPNTGIQGQAIASMHIAEESQ
jgi:hypothetical protein